MIFSLVEEVPFAAIVDKRYGIDRAESLFERRTAARFEMKSGNSSRAGSAPDKRVGIELLLKDLLLLLSIPSLKTIIPDSPTLASEQAHAIS